MLQYLSALCPLYLGKLERSIWANINADGSHEKVLTCTNATEIKNIGVCIYIGVYTHTHIYIYIYIYIHIYTHTHTHIYSYCQQE